MDGIYMLYDSILEAIGNTPLIALRRYCAGFRGSIFLKMESMNPGGSHKARIGLNMVRAALSEGKVKPGGTILEATGGNTGKGITMAAAVLGLATKLVIPAAYSDRKVKMLEALGADVERSDSSRSLTANSECVAELQFDKVDWFQLLQMENPANPQIHRETTAPEILRDMSPRRIDYFVAGFGTGGHLTGIGEMLRASFPELRVIAVQPEECDLESSRYRPHKLQGLSVGFTPKNLNRALISEVAKVSYEDALRAIERLLRMEAIGVGPSSGAVLAAAGRIAERCSDDANIVCLAYDSIDDYPEIIDEILRLRRGH